jgi:undecaprenyl-diphosphatase
METLILHYSSEWTFLAYFLLFIGMIFEGELFYLAAIFSAHAGHLNTTNVIILATVGMMVGDILWYWFGPLVIEKLFPIKIKEKVIPRIDSMLKKRPTSTLIYSKFIYIAHRISLGRSKAAGLNFLSFIKRDFTAIFIWISTITVLGFVFSASFILLKKYLRFAEVSLLITIFIIYLAEVYLNKFFAKNSENLENKI